MSDFRFTHSSVLAPGRTVFRARNAGRVNHELVLVPLPEGFPPIDKQLRGSTRRRLPNLAFIPPRRPGTTSVFAVDLVAGRYAFICPIADTDGVAHFLKGMSSEFVVRAPS
ncbi:MAG TPA: hypothetical protein VM142_10635 [Acidimicrobiales bacterium]|nr:hypothetical protein [Acidimicrobiales bacterium]